MQKKQQISHWLRTKLLQEMRTGRYEGMLRLPPEITVARDLGVSRTILRDALASLEREGFISRKHGVGTLINYHVLNIPTRLDIDEEYMDMFRQAGKEPRQAFLHSSLVKASSEVAVKLNIRENDPVYEVVRLILADGEPAIYCRDYFAKKLIEEERYDESELREPIFDFLEKYCHVQVQMDVTAVRAISAQGDAAERLNVPQGTPILSLDEVDYDFWGRPVLYAQQMFRDGALQHMVVRQRL